MGVVKSYFRFELCFILFTLMMFTIVRTETPTPSSASPMIVPSGNCSCGGFPTETPEPNADPLISQAPGLTLKCDQEGEETCKNLCIALATAAKAKGPGLLCSRVINANELKFAVFFKACEKPWTYGGMTAEEPLCCENSEVKPCPSSLTSAPPLAPGSSIST